MKRKSERRSAWATAPPCSRRSSSSSPGVKKSRSSTPQELHRLEQQDDLYLDITGEPRHTPTRLAPPRASSGPRACRSNFTGEGPWGHLCKCARPRERGGPVLEPTPSRDKPARLSPRESELLLSPADLCCPEGPKPRRALATRGIPLQLLAVRHPPPPPQAIAPSPASSGIFALPPMLPERCHVDGV